MEKKNRIAILRQKLLDADKDLDRVNKALHDLRTVTEELEEDKEPTLNEYYEPSDEMKTYMDIVTGRWGLSPVTYSQKSCNPGRLQNFSLNYVARNQKT